MSCQAHTIGLPGQRRPPHERTHERPLAAAALADMDSACRWIGAALIAAFKRRAMTRWYLYGFACTLVAWPLLALPTIHALLIWRHDIPKLSPNGSVGPTHWP